MFEEKRRQKKSNEKEQQKSIKALTSNLKEDNR